MHLIQILIRWNQSELHQYFRRNQMNIKMEQFLFFGVAQHLAPFSSGPSTVYSHVYSVPLWTGICSLYLRPLLMTVANYAGFPAQHFHADWSMKLSGERPTLTGGLNKTLERLMSVCGCLSWYWSFYTLRSEGTRYMLSRCDRALKLKTENAWQLPVYNQFVCCTN